MRTICFFLVVSVIIFSAVFFTTQAVRAAGAEKAGSSDIAAKLDDIAATQKAILEELAFVKNELYIIKIRVTQQQ